ncbi:hypothetical protein CAMRE0001_2190 [Campylobacter rectus RM3267]|uniref:Uncharacterized protein n=1 Tax=Campylobacter rectus RM3267 TaxID=553218 RepID=B9D493_CAMRE|nr:hypothetical protein CAMRE0001_2190 [Campylobacter rectus RM3267]
MLKFKLRYTRLRSRRPIFACVKFVKFNANYNSRNDSIKIFYRRLNLPNSSRKF